MPDSGVRRKLTVTSCNALRSGVGKNDKPWTMYEVFAVDEGGAPVEAKLRSFDPLKLNELVEYEITKREDQRHGTSYTLKKPGKREPPPDPRLLQAKIEEQRVAIEKLTRRTTDVEAALRAFQAWASGLDSGVSAPPDMEQLGAGAPASAALATDADIPF